MDIKKSATRDLIEGAQLHPQHESWVGITTRSSLIGGAVFLALIVLLVIVVDLHFSGSALAFLGMVGVLIFGGFVMSTTPMRRRGFLGNAELTCRIKADLITELGASDVNVDSSKGVVTLRGSVPYPDFRVQAEHLARRSGARRVMNELRVSGHRTIVQDSYIAGMPAVTTTEGAPEVASHPPLEQMVRGALEDDPRVNAYLLNIRVEDGIACLTGRQDMTDASDAATQVALRVPGILGVSNDIEIESSV